MKIEDWHCMARLRAALGDTLPLAQRNRFAREASATLASAPDAWLPWPLQPAAIQALKKFYAASAVYRAAVKELLQHPAAVNCIYPRALHQLRAALTDMAPTVDRQRGGQVDWHADFVCCALARDYARAFGSIPGTGENSPFVRVLDEINAMALPGVPALSRKILQRIAANWPTEAEWRNEPDAARWFAT